MCNVKGKVEKKKHEIYHGKGSIVVGMAWPMAAEGFSDQSHFYYNI